jgi:hypothetical protein
MVVTQNIKPGSIQFARQPLMLALRLLFWLIFKVPRFVSPDLKMGRTI